MRLDILAALVLALGIALVERLFLAGVFLFAWGLALTILQVAFR